MNLERAGLVTFLVGLAIAFLSSVPFLLNVVANTDAGREFAGNLVWQGWAVAAVVSGIGLIMTMLADNSSATHRRRAI